MIVKSEIMEVRGISEKKGKKNNYFLLNLESVTSGEQEQVYCGFDNPNYKKGSKISITFDLYSMYGKLNKKILSIIEEV